MLEVMSRKRNEREKETGYASKEDPTWTYGKLGTALQTPRGWLGDWLMVRISFLVIGSICTVMGLIKELH